MAVYTKFYRGRWSLGTNICRSTSTLLVPFPSSTEGAGHLVPKFVEGHPHCARPICKSYRGRWTSTLCSSICKFYRGRWSRCQIRRRTSTLCSSHLQVLPRALVTWCQKIRRRTSTLCSSICKFYRGLVTWYQNLSKYIHLLVPFTGFCGGRWSPFSKEFSRSTSTLLVPFASSTEGAGHLVPKFVEVHPHCARPICKFYRGRWSLGTKICRSTSTLLVPFASSTEGAGHLVPKFVEVHPHSSSHLQVLLRALVTWYQNLSKYIHTPRPICKFYRGRWSLGTKICRSTSTLCSSHLQVLPRTLVTWYINSSKDIHIVLVPFASSTEDAGHLVPKSKSMSTYTVFGHFQAFLKAYT
ncbi:hypothetical protein J6590_066816 [Homalodisca vitripennis]|nr:hypothetical protein J6590_066816 [Homalodisca vitripennis]